VSALIDPEERRDPGAAFARLVAVIRRLRGPDGCDWDRAQTVESLRPYVLEEAYEVADAIDAGSPESHREELGDLLMQVVLQAAVREPLFDAADVAHGIADKLVRRHPHVFAGADPATVDWEREKAKERPRESALDGVPRAAPALVRARRIGEKARAVGFDWPDRSGPLAKLREELDEVAAALETADRAAVADEIGDLLFSIVNLSRFLEVDPEAALSGAVAKFERRFREVERRVRAAGEVVGELGLDALEAQWRAVKAEE